MRKEHILIADNIPENIKTLRQILKTDYKITSAANGKDALKLALSRKSFDLILVNTAMPGTDGYEVCRRLKADPRYQKIPVILTGDPPEEQDESRGFEMGAADYMRKPFGKAIVKARVHLHLELMRCCNMLEEVSCLDALTGIKNRFHFDEVMALEWRLAIRETHLLSIMKIQIDHFEAFNKEYSPRAGNECLRQVAKTLSASLRRPMDCAARYSKNEFAAILPRTSSRGVTAVAEMMRRNVELLNIPHARSPVSDRVTISVGNATATPSKNFSSDLLIKAADEALADAKTHGNQVKSVDLSPSLTLVVPEFL
ncbi:diguanylate cyclase domain-containing protein [Desulfonema magnum]|uniref:diguanylate cyclase n=1 Tax=Desulfonema magnum TaxID=45655 RepID=A0A975BUD8_9BACT|nr:diguanylate cyclase [Desulfonema magnum]QTA91941.1 Two component system response regulator, GGDEF domain-containing [Desulfonema magnum]